nr:MAG TPA: hypothetical protein [Caudoviricetes sp.]
MSFAFSIKPSSKCPTVRLDVSVTPCVIAVNPTVGHNLLIVNFL